MAFTLAWKVEVKVPSPFWTTLIGEPPLRTPWPERRRLFCGEEKVSVKVWPVTGSAGLTIGLVTPKQAGSGVLVGPAVFVGTAVFVGAGVPEAVAVAVGVASMTSIVPVAQVSLPSERKL